MYINTEVCLYIIYIMTHTCSSAVRSDCEIEAFATALHFFNFTSRTMFSCARNCTICFFALNIEF